MPPGTRGWGGVARRGARVLDEARSSDGQGRRAATPPRHPGRAEPGWEPDVWVEESAAPPRRRAARAPTPRRTRAPVPEAVGAELADAAGRARAPRLAERLGQAVRAYEADRYGDARRILKPLAAAAPGAASVRELYGLTLYRMGRWAEAIKELEAFHALTGSLDQHPVLADSRRALGHWKKVDEVWDELRRASPGAELVAEGRIVAAGARADRGDVAGALRLLERVPVSLKRPRLHHLRTWYAMADLYERAGELPRARQVFRIVVRHAPDFVDASERLAALS